MLGRTRVARSNGATRFVLITERNHAGSMCTNAPEAIIGRPVANHIAARVRRVLPGKICYALGGVLALIAESAGSYTVTSGEATLFSGPALNLTLANGASFGGGMRISPASVVSDGTLDLVVIGAIGRIRALLALSRLYAGTHVRMGGIRVVPARQPVHLRRADRAMLIEADGEEFEAGNDLWVDILPGAVQLL